MSQIIVSKSPVAPFNMFRYSIQDKGIVLRPTESPWKGNILNIPC